MGVEAASLEGAEEDGGPGAVQDPGGEEHGVPEGKLRCLLQN